VSAVRYFGAAASPIVTRAELEARLAARSRPAPERHLTPLGWQAGETRREVDTANENRIAHIQVRLERAKENFRAGHALAQVRGKARDDFGRCD
jgi:hypothetical protein